MFCSSAVEGFKLAYDRYGSGRPVVLLHGWPGDRTDYDVLGAALADSVEVIVPDLRGFGASDKHPADPEQAYSGAGQARAISALLDELGVTTAVFVGYDVGSFVAQTVARTRPELHAARGHGALRDRDQAAQRGLRPASTEQAVLSV